MRSQQMSTTMFSHFQLYRETGAETHHRASKSDSWFRHKSNNNNNKKRPFKIQGERVEIAGKSMWVMGRTSDLCKSSSLCGFRLRAIAMRSLQAVNRAEPMGWRLGIVPPSMLWEMLAWAELEPTQMEKDPGRADLWVFCPRGRSTVVTAEPKSKTHCHTLTVSHGLLRTHWLELSLTTQWQLLDVSYFANESSHSRNILQRASYNWALRASPLLETVRKMTPCTALIIQIFSWVQMYIAPSQV